MCAYVICLCGLLRMIFRLLLGLVFDLLRGVWAVVSVLFCLRIECLIASVFVWGL